MFSGKGLRMEVRFCSWPTEDGKINLMVSISETGPKFVQMETRSIIVTGLQYLAQTKQLLFELVLCVAWAYV